MKPQRKKLLNKFINKREELKYIDEDIYNETNGTYNIKCKNLDKVNHRKCYIKNIRSAQNNDDK